MAALSGSDLRGKVALVVGGGATGGIGFATAEAFAAGRRHGCPGGSSLGPDGRDPGEARTPRPAFRP